MNDAELLQYMGTDARKWAEEFVRIYRRSSYDEITLDVEMMTGWFANAIEAGADREKRRERAAT